MNAVAMNDNRPSAEIIDLHDFFVKPPAKTLQEAKERIFAELPPRPDFENMADWEMVEAMMNWDRMRLYVYQTAVGQ